MTKFLFPFLTLLLLSGFSQAKEEVIKDRRGNDCYLYVPDQIDKKKTYWLVVGIHDTGKDGKGAAGLSSWVKRDDCIVIGPSFEEGYASASDKHAKVLLDLHKKLSKDYKLHNRMFLHGFGDGAQFAQRFTFIYARFVGGCSAHSSNQWATGGKWGQMSGTAFRIPFAISCGAQDTEKPFAGAPMTRLEWFQEFEKRMLKDKFKVTSKVLPNVGHKATPTIVTMAEACFQEAQEVFPTR